MCNWIFEVLHFYLLFLGKFFVDDRRKKIRPNGSFIESSPDARLDEVVALLLEELEPDVAAEAAHVEVHLAA